MSIDTLEEILTDLAESYYPEHEYNDTWREKNRELVLEAKQALNLYIEERIREANSRGYVAGYYDAKNNEELKGK